MHAKFTKFMSFCVICKPRLEPDLTAIWIKLFSSHLDLSLIQAAGLQKMDEPTFPPILIKVFSMDLILIQVYIRATALPTCITPEQAGNTSRPLGSNSPPKSR